MDSLRQIHEVHLEVADSCNLGCPYCYFNSKKRILSEYPISRLKEILEGIFSFTTNPINIVFHGGEPLLRSAEWYDKACSLAETLATNYNRKIRFQLQTNGTLLTTDHVSVFKKYRVIVSISLDGPKYIHDSARGGFTQTIKSIRLLQNAFILGSVITVISKHNFRHVDSIVELLKNLGIKSFHFNIASVVNSNDSITLAPEEILEYYLASYQSFVKNYKDICDWFLLGKLKRLVRKEIPNFHCDSPICGGGLYKTHVLPDGSFYPCGSCVSTLTAKESFVQGNILKGQEKNRESFLSQFHSIYFKNRSKCEKCPAMIICDFFCPAFDSIDLDTAFNRCLATQQFYVYLQSRRKQEIEEIVEFYAKNTPTSLSKKY